MKDRILHDMSNKRFHIAQHGFEIKSYNSLTDDDNYEEVMYNDDVNSPVRIHKAVRKAIGLWLNTEVSASVYKLSDLQKSVSTFIGRALTNENGRRFTFELTAKDTIDFNLNKSYVGGRICIIQHFIQ